MKIKNANLYLKVILCAGSRIAIADTTHNPVLPTVEVREDASGEGYDIAHLLFPKTDYATPSFDISKKATQQYNVTTTEDVLRYAPGLLIRRRYIGDPNGNLGIRGSNVFQTAHTSVYGDGMPLHNPLRQSFNGAPRWSMVNPTEIESAEVLYGPFSAQYGGHSFGGVVNLTTRMPEKFEAHFDGTGMFQDMHRAGRNQVLSGYRTFVSGGDRFDKFSVYASYNRVENDGQPMDPINSASFRTTGAVGTPVTGGLSTPIQGNPNTPGILFGDSGVEHTETDLFKLKMAYDIREDLQARFVIAYENRDRNNEDPNSLLRNAAGNTVYSGNFNQNGQRFTVPGTAFAVSTQNRETLNYGLSLKGKISEDWRIDTTASYFDAFKDKSVAPRFSTHDPLNNNSGQITDVSAWWASYDLKLATDRFLDRDDLSFMSGYQFNHASLGINVDNVANLDNLGRRTFVSDSGGATQINSGFSQLEWRFMPDWSVMAGARYDHWQALDGRTPVNNVQRNIADRDASRISPKASLEYSPDAWTFRYSFSKAYRFPIAEEMFASFSRLTSQSIAFPGLGPENGLFHNFMTQYDIQRGYIRANFFFNQINDEIFSTTQSINGVNTTTFLPIGQTETIGMDLTFQQNQLFDLPIDLMTNVIFMNKQITKNQRNPALVGNEWVRIPRLQANVSATYHILPVWDATAGVRYRSDSFQREDNSDTAANVFSGTDEYTFVDFKTSYRLPVIAHLKSTLSAGIDNILDQNVFENNPYPQRTFYATISLDY